MPQPQKEPNDALSRSLQPVCCRHEHPMSLEEKGVTWKEGDETQTLRCYHCNYPGCTVRYSPAAGYFTVIEAPEAAHFVEEPGVNVFQCPLHQAWMYRSKMAEGRGLWVWRCGVEGCDHSTAQPSPMTATG